MCVLTMLKISENNGPEEIGLVTPTPDVAGRMGDGCVFTRKCGSRSFQNLETVLAMNTFATRLRSIEKRLRV